ncbi:MAG: prepilin-type N-terminal cleavage/methylation domain-containing protein [Nitrospirae bacterium]|nr:MAG: prepilin-type N-terminal cleavage/methylation domain-containing protein [Nitrospirota bacterium]
MFKLNEKGFTLLEAIMAVAILAIALVGLITTQAQFSTQTADRTAMNCIVDAAVSAAAECQSSITPTNKSCAERGNATITITASNSCSPASGACNDVTITASGLNRSFVMTTRVCN